MNWLSKLLGKQTPEALVSSHPVMKDYLSADKPDVNCSISEVSFLIADLEMTGLDSSRDEIVSMGWVVIEDLKIVHSRSNHFYINNTEVNLDKSAPIHGISHRELAQGVSLEQAANELIGAMKSKVLVLHHAPLDMSFLNKLCNSIYQVNLSALLIDTMDIEHKRLSRRGRLEGTSLRLGDSRSRYNLPNYKAHNAAIDALATAELLLAQIAHENSNKEIKLKDYLS